MNETNPSSPPPQLTPLQGFVLGWNRYAEFMGRSSRMEYWSFTIINMFIGIFLSLLAVIPGVIFNLVILIPSYAVLVRRLHDIGQSGLWVFGAVASWVAVILVFIGKVSGSISDHDFSGLLILSGLFVAVMNLIPLIMCFVDGNPETNQYGPNPKLNPTNPNNPV